MKYAVLEQGIPTFFGTHEECCEYLDNVCLGWEKRVCDKGIIPWEDENEEE